MDIHVTTDPTSSAPLISLHRDKPNYLVSPIRFRKVDVNATTSCPRILGVQPSQCFPSYSLKDRRIDNSMCPTWCGETDTQVACSECFRESTASRTLFAVANKPDENDISISPVPGVFAFYDASGYVMDVSRVQLARSFGTTLMGDEIEKAVNSREQHVGWDEASKLCLCDLIELFA
jgi:hypothetical protein